ncbi:MAG TPA: hypothetical protein VFG35_30335 [Actinoplanes sp.]|nr:hypothetical protein [Actinoplanes sp.]
MTEQPHHRQLREAFESNENNIADPSAVYARVQELSQKYKRRRRGAQVAAGGVLGAGLIAGAINLPAAAPAASLSTRRPEATLQAQLKAYYDAGYGYDNAQQLAAAWNQGNSDLVPIKAEAGRRLLLGETLPVKPSPDQPVEEKTVTPTQAKQFGAFFTAGYTWDEAAKLAKLWKLADPSAAKLEAGKRLLAGQELPIKPKLANVQEAEDNKLVGAFFAKGYDAHDAVKLARLWHLKGPYQAKIEGGKRILAGQPLPIQP